MKRLALVVAVCVVASCEVPLDPIEPSDLYFSLSGYLDANVDTQWVRVEPLARTADPDPGEIDATVTMTNLATGTATTLTQTLRTFSSGPAHLFWTTTPVNLGGRYRVEATRSDGAVTSADIEIPADGTFTVEVISDDDICPTSVIVRGAERVVDVQARYVVFKGGRIQEFSFSRPDEIRQIADDEFRASIYYGEDALRMGLDPLDLGAVLEAEVTVGISTDAWPDVAEFSVESLLLAQDFGVENGVGFIGGAVTDRQPFRPGVSEIGFGVVRPCIRGQ